MLIVWSSIFYNIRELLSLKWIFSGFEMYPSEECGVRIFQLSGNKQCVAGVYFMAGLGSVMTNLCKKCLV